MNPARLLMRRAPALAVWLLSFCSCLLLSACANISGLGGSAEYACKAPKGVQCDSVSGNYYNALQNNLPGQRRQWPSSATAYGMSSSDSPPAARRSLSISEIAQSAANTGPVGISQAAVVAEPLRSQSRVLRLWFKPWEDADHDLYDQGFVYVQIDQGDWLIEHAQQRIRDAYAPIRPPRPPGTRPTGPAKPGESGPAGGASDTNSGATTGPFSTPLKPSAGPSNGPVDLGQ